MNSYLMIGIPILIILLIIAYIVLYNRLNRLRIKVEEAGADIDVALEKRFDLLSEEIEAVKKYLSHEYQIMTDLTAARVGADLEEKRMAQQQEISEEVLKSIDQEIARQTRTMEQIRGKLGSIQRRIRRRNGMREEDPTRQETLAQAEERRGAALSQKVGALAGVHRDLSSVGAGINGLAEQYPILNSWVSMDHFQRSIYDSEEHLQAARRLYNANVSMYNQTLASIPWSIVASICRMEKAAFYEVEERKRDFQVNFD
nr:LemA family protein [uncultured Oscillibacter sp.]